MCFAKVSEKTSFIDFFYLPVSNQLAHDASHKSNIVTDDALKLK